MCYGLNSKLKRRDQIAIVAKILDICKEGSLKTQVMYRANLSFSQLNDYLPYLQRKDLLTQSNVEGKDYYVITQKGLNFLKGHNALARILETDERIRRA